MKQLVIFLLGFLCFHGFSQSIVSVEYFFDADPGVGNGTALSVNANTGELIQSYSIPTTGLSDGFHSLYFRTLNEEGNWGFYDRYIIYLKDFAGVDSDIVSAEYFIDSDPGIGNGTSFSISTSTEMIAFDTDGLADGDHFFYVRVLNANGEWSFYDYALFTINPDLGVEESLLQSIVIHPNPVKNVVNITSSIDLIITNTVIYDLTGKTVYQSKDNLKQLDVSGFSSGIYLLNLTTDKGSASYKLVKQ
ncbi:MAG: T9SS type A sorting domain-containing protein [Flavobacteriaceae bacterium]|nr:T9SS type A sorting domain-containing protein [Flavobacteriaceae bacterium]MCB0475866.1 T9SS type A sorting domain-containing protein [Flavobacteriaceae bacterium]